MKEIILDIIGAAAILLSLYAYFFMGYDFWQCTGIGITGIALFVFKESYIRKFVEKFINKYLDK